MTARYEILGWLEVRGKIEYQRPGRARTEAEAKPQ
jgi:hypothetical protein